MNRKYTRQIFLETVERLKAAHPDFTFTTDVIVGFPGETDTDFNDTLEVMRQVKFAKVHMFPYSDRPRTRAALMPHKTPIDIIKTRKAQVLELAEQLAFELREAYVGRTMQILTETVDAGRVNGYTANFLPVWMEGTDVQSNQLINVKLIANSPTGLIGSLS
jgi:threonylcarbamoyladenosine tRNA methylthiotransferase MtaB